MSPHSRRIGAQMGLALASMFVLSGLLIAQSDSPPAEISYRMIFAPIEQILELTTEEMRAVKREQFDIWASAELAAPERISDGVSIVQADYQAVFDGKHLVNGTGNLRIRSAQAAASRLSLEPMNLPMTEPQWSEAPGKNVELGVQGDGRLAVNVPVTATNIAPHIDTLRFRWTLANIGTGAGETTFRLQLPRCPINQLRLTIPDTHSLDSDVGVVSRLTDRPSEKASLWQLDAGGHATITLRIRSNDAPRATVFLRQTNTYTMSEQGIELTADLHLDSEEAAIDELQLELSPKLQLTRVRLGKDPVSWTVAAAGMAEPTTVLLTLDPPLKGLNRVLSLTCFRPSDRSEPAGLQPLPRVQAPSMRWQQELARIRIQRPLVLEDLQLEKASQIQPSQVDSEADRETVNVWFLQPSAKLLAQVAPAPKQIVFDQGTSVTVTASEAVAEVAIRLRSTSSDIFEFQAVVQPNWQIDAVESDRVESIHDWKLRSDPTSKQDILSVSLREPISTDMDTTLRVRARRRFNATEREFIEGDFRPIRPRGRGARRRFLTIRTADDLSLRFGQDRRVTWLTLDDLDATEVGLVEANEDSAIILVNENHRDLDANFSSPDGRPASIQRGGGNHISNHRSLGAGTDSSQDRSYHSTAAAVESTANLSSGKIDSLVPCNGPSTNSRQSANAKRKR